MYEAKGTGLETVQPQQIAAQVNAEVQETAAAGEEQSAQPVTEAAAISREDFEETLYFLDASELEKLQQEVKTEIERDLKTDVLNALFDRLEDGNTARQLEILGVLRQLLPIFMSRGDLASAALMLRELDGLLGRDLLTGEARAEVDHLFEELSEPSILGQLIQTIEEGGINPAAEELSLFFMNLRPAALPLLIRTAEVTQQAGFRARLQAAIDRLAGQHRDAIVALLQDAEATVAGGAARLVARLKVSEAAPLLAALLQRPEPALRLSAVDALVGLPSAVGMKALEQALEDESRDVRIAAARGLGALKWQSSRGRFEEVLQARTLREADLTEKIAFFEAYGALGPESVALLDRFLNGKGMLGRRQPPEIRACAALALGKVATPAARKALQQASSETDPVVRSAVQRALRQETPAT
ncbi:MAG: HEAT repeat domain-containing protein [Gemmatimonadetes bacterium]|nr:HEAT repeat domain-containing protein [Gemmatimonadota bacterium]